MSLPRAFSGDTYRTSVRSCNSPARALRTRRSMHARKAASVLPEPVGAEIRVVRPARMCGHPCSCGSVGVPKRWTNQSCTNGWAQVSGWGTGKRSEEHTSELQSHVNLVCRLLLEKKKKQKKHENKYNMHM